MDPVSDLRHISGGRTPEGLEFTLCGLMEKVSGEWLHLMRHDVPWCEDCVARDA